MVTYGSKQTTPAAVPARLPESTTITRWTVGREMGRVMVQEHGAEMGIAAWFFVNGLAGVLVGHFYFANVWGGLFFGMVAGVLTGVVAVAVDAVRLQARQNLGLDPKQRQFYP